MKFFLKISLIVILSLLALSVIINFIVPRSKITPTQVTRHRMDFLRGRILEYARTQGELPADLSALARLPVKPEYEHWRKPEDCWRRKIIYEVDASGRITLKSFGKDGVPGGSGRNADIVLSFPSRRPDGTWSEASDSY